MTRLSIRSGTRRDLDAVLGLWRAAESVPTVTDTPSAVERLLAVDPDALVVAELGSVVVGAVIVGFDGWRGSMYRVAVAPDRRRQGIGSELVREGKRRLRERGARRMSVIVVDDDRAAMAFWSITGLTQQDHRARFVRDL